MALIERLAREIPDAQVVLIGAAISSMDRFDALPNVHWLGAKPYEEIPAYGSGFDVGLMPYLRNEWIRHSNPIKSREYLALGLPVVATAVPQLEQFAAVMSIAVDEDDFVEAVRAALRGEAPANPQERRAAVAGTSWDDRAETLMPPGRSGRALAVCGIVGIRRFDGQPVSEQLLRLMADQLVHRGPDDDGFWVDGSIGFGHRRLSIIDVGSSAQPMVSVGRAAPHHLQRRDLQLPRAAKDLFLSLSYRG